MPTPISHPTEEEWDEFLNLIYSLEQHAEAQTAFLQTLSNQIGIHPTQSQFEALLRDTTQIQRILQQAGKKKERRFSPPRISFPHPSLSWLWVIPVLTALLALWHSSAVLWNGLTTLLP